MSKDKSTLTNVDIEIEPAEVVAESPKAPTVSERRFYDKRIWRANKIVFVCLTCDLNLSQEDDMQLHVLSHYPADQQDKILDEMTSSKEN